MFRSAQQDRVANSTTEGEFVAAAESVKQLLWVQAMLKELQVNYGKVVLNCDSETAIRCIKNPAFHRSTKHIDIKYHFIRERYNEGLFELEYVPTKRQLAYLTKAIPREHHINLITQSHIVPIRNVK